VARKRQSDMVEGFEVFKALNLTQQESLRRGKSAKDSAASKGDSAEGAGKPRKIASHIGHTAMPPKHELACFECGFNFQITGKIDSIECPRCKVPISLRDVTIDSEWFDDIKTGGTILITANAVVKNSELIAKEIVLDGKIEDGSVNAYQRLILMPNGFFDEELITARDLIVESKTSLTLEKAAHFQNVDIGGSLTARELEVDCLLSVRTGGIFSGKVQARRFRLDEGGGLKARLKIGEQQNGGT